VTGREHRCSGGAVPRSYEGAALTLASWRGHRPVGPGPPGLDLSPPRSGRAAARAPRRCSSAGTGHTGTVEVSGRAGGHASPPLRRPRWPPRVRREEVHVDGPTAGTEPGGDEPQRTAWSLSGGGSPGFRRPAARGSRRARGGAEVPPRGGRPAPPTARDGARPDPDPRGASARDQGAAAGRLRPEREADRDPPSRPRPARCRPRGGRAPVGTAPGVRDLRGARRRR
jgi:hypothetical protein